MELLKVENLCKIYGEGENEVRAVNDVSFSVPKGQMVAVIGASGSGNENGESAARAEWRNCSWEIGDCMKEDAAFAGKVITAQEGTLKAANRKPHGAVFEIRFFRTTI